MEPLQIIATYCKPQSPAYAILAAHGRQVARKSLAVAAGVPHLRPDLEFIERAALLHDIGIIQTDSPELGCHGRRPYICHGVLGREMLEADGLTAEALVCERHVGVGLRAAEIRARKLPLPERDMIPRTIEEEIICYADKFFSKNGSGMIREKSMEEIITGLKVYGQDKVQRFLQWVELFEN
jgi:uncharacterized protein